MCTDLVLLMNWKIFKGELIAVSPSDAFHRTVNSSRNRIPLAK